MQACNDLSIKSNVNETSISFHSDITDELSCTQLKENLDEGCCIDESGLCSATTRESCGASLFEESACSSVALCDCEAHKEKRCDGEDVYWYDSCGNKEELADDCDYGTGTICSSENDEAACVSVDCETTLNKKTLWGDDIRDDDGVQRKNGESWCQYDGAVGLGKDLVGSRHYRHLCINGKEQVESCKDYREEICIEGDIEFEGGETIRQARCVANNYADCTTTCNSAQGITDPKQREAALQKDAQCCQNPERTCFWKSVSQEEVSKAVGELPKLCKDEQGNDIACGSAKTSPTEGVCLPLVPPGGNFWGKDDDGTQESQADLQALCEPASQTCSVYFTKSVSTGFDWEIAGNGQCLNPDKFIIPAQGTCGIYGDCGIDYNVAGKLGDDAYDCSTSDGGCKGAVHGVPYDFVSINWDKALGGKGAFAKATTLYFGNVKIDDKGFGTFKTAGLAYTASIAATLAVIAYVPGAAAAFINLVATGTAAAVLVADVGATTSATGILATTGAALCSTVVGCIAGIVFLVAAAVMTVLSLGFNEEDKFDITNTCNAWQAPKGGEDCELCRDPDVYEQLGYDTCSEYRCKSLGTRCMYLPENEGSIRNPCVESAINDVSAPIITPNPDVLTDGLTITTEQNGYELTPIVPSYTSLTFGILTNEPAKCKLSETPTQTYDNMTADFGDPYYGTEHTMSILPTPSSTTDLYVKCEDVAGNHNDADYLIRFTVSSEPDLTPPLIVETNPASDAQLTIGQHTLEISLNEPAQCKYDPEATAYESMKQSFSCTSSTKTSPLAKYSCSTSITVIDGDNNYYIRCKDTAGNVNTDATLISIQAVPALTITNIIPNGTVQTNTLTLTATTNGGANNGYADCSYELDGTHPFTTTGNSEHSTDLPQLSKGSHTIPITCTDGISSASNNAQFTILKDDTAPSVKNFFTQSNDLIIITDEDATCRHAPGTFTYENGEAFSESASTQHSTPIVQTTYHIICADVDGNIGQEIVLVP